MSTKKRKLAILDDSKVNFVCQRCQRIYYQEDLDSFEANPKLIVRQAYEYRRYYHDCKRR